jgi:hypothetical protein
MQTDGAGTEEAVEGAPPEGSPAPPLFRVRECDLVRIATGVRAMNLRELRDGIARVHRGSIYHHFWGRLLEPTFDEPEYSNDFASWASRALNEKAIAEQLAMINPADCEDLEEMRQDLLDTIEATLDDERYVAWSRADQQFHFCRSQLIVVDAGRSVDTPEELGRILPTFSEQSVFYHFIDARRRTDNGWDDFRSWLSGFGDGYNTLIERVGAVDPYFSSLGQLRRRLTRLFAEELGLEEAAS